MHKVIDNILSVGHSSHTWNIFLGLLTGADVEAVIDVRSSPRSRFRHFTAPLLRSMLNDNGLPYLQMGSSLGGRGFEGDYEAIAQTPLFKDGIARVLAIASRCRPALLCSEHDPINCHRCLLVGRSLREHGATVLHILRDGRIEPQEQTEERLLALTGHAHLDLYANRSDRLREAYRVQELRVRGGPRRTNTDRTPRVRTRYGSDAK